MTNLDTRLEKAIKKRASLSKEVDRLIGRQEEAEKNLQAVEEECRAKKFEPEQIDQVIEQLETLYASQVEELEKEIAESEQKLAPYLGDNNT